MTQGGSLWVKKPIYKVEYDNDVGPNDDYYRQFWTVYEDDIAICECDDEIVAHKIAKSMRDQNR